VIAGLALGPILLTSPSVVRAEEDAPAQGAAADQEASADKKVVTLWNLRYSDADGDAGLCDLFLPRLPGDDWRKRPAEARATLPDQSASTSTPAPEAGPETLPVRIDGPRRPAVLVVHGGGWAAGDKWQQGVYGKGLAQAGVVAMNINYRLAPEYPFPAAVDDVRTALLYLVDHADELAVDVDRIGLWGYSAGGHLVSLVAAMADEERATQVASSGWAKDDPRWERLPRVRALCAGGAPCDFREIPPRSDALAFFLKGPRQDFSELYHAASPTAFASAGDPPTRLIHGDRDLLVPLDSSREFHAALQAAGVAAELSVCEGQGHMATFLNPTTMANVVEFLSNQLEPSTP